MRQHTLQDWFINMSTGVATLILDNEKRCQLEKDDIKDLFWRLVDNNMLAGEVPPEMKSFKIKKHKIDSMDIRWFMLDYLTCFDVSSFE